MSENMQQKSMLLSIPVAPIVVLLFIAVVYFTYHYSGGQAEYKTWAHYGGGPSHIQYSVLDQINTDNVHQLEAIWSRKIGGKEKADQMRLSPLVIDGILYASSPSMKMIALDAVTGEIRWEFHMPQDYGPSGADKAGMIRGLASWGSGKKLRIYFTSGHFLYAVLASDGTIIKSFGEQGRVDLRKGLGRPHKNLAVFATTPGVIFKDLIIMGSSIPETLPSAPGDIRAYDVHTGETRWTFHTIPHPGEYGYETWPPDAWQYAGGANNWAGMCLDEKRGVVYLGTGAAADDFYGANRTGDNLFANSLLALDARTGKRIWHYQFIKHDVWDRDVSAPPALVTVERDGKKIDAVVQVTKSGHTYVFNRDTGESLFPIEEFPVAASELPGEVLAKTQRFPTLPKPFARQVVSEDMVYGRAPDKQAMLLKQFREFDYGGQFIPPSLKTHVLLPGMDGGAQWGGIAFDPETAIMYVNSNDVPWLLQLYETAPLPPGSKASDVYVNFCQSCHGPDMLGTDDSSGRSPGLKNLSVPYTPRRMAKVIRLGKGSMPSFAEVLGWDAAMAVSEYVLTGADNPIATAVAEDTPFFIKYRLNLYRMWRDSGHYPAIEPPWGTMNAINLNTGEYVWRKPFGEYPELAEQGVPTTGTMNYGGPVVTRGGLVFIGATMYDRKFRAFDKSNGELLWEYVLPGSGMSTPAVYEIDGRQFIAISTGGRKWGGFKANGNYLVTFALPKAVLPR